MKVDRFGQAATYFANRLPVEGGRFKRHKWVAHLNTVVSFEDQMNRSAILRENAMLYEQNKVKRRNRKEFVGGYPLRIPEIDYEELKKLYPEARGQAAKEEINKFWKKVYRENREYRIG